jgi:hypothetical protein
MPENNKHKYEYDHFVLGPDIHYGKHSAFGRHLAVGSGANSVHLYSTKIYIGGKKGTSVPLSPEQVMIMSRILSKLDQKVKEDQLLEHLSGDTENGDT